ncbi:MAG: hypothetical protein JW863_20905 [Chitinispirillaceae bacterium]|nr:hypothetical protein [Chitinispirillaceae bacterium]
MKKMALIVPVVWLYLLAAGCVQSDPQVRVRNRNDEPVSITIESDHRKGDMIMITDVPPDETSDYVTFPPAMGGTVSASRNGDNPDAIRYSALAGKSYLITMSSGDNPVLTWEIE